jgi:hypothetical protein
MTIQPSLGLSLELELKRLVRAIIVLLSHLILAVVMIGGLWLLQILSQGLFERSNTHLFSEEVLNYIFDVTNVTVLFMFILNGITEVFQSYRRRSSRDRLTRGWGR